MGVSISRPLRRSKYTVHTLDGESSVFDESEKFLSPSSQQQKTNTDTLRRSKGSSKRNEPQFFQLKPVRGKPMYAFDSLDTIESRKSVPFAVLPEDNTRASTSSPDGEGELISVHSNEETITLEKSDKLLFLDEVVDDLEDENSAKKCAKKFKEKNMPRPTEYVHQKVIAPLQGKLGRSDPVSSITRSGKEAHLPDGNHSRRSKENTRDSVVVTLGECANGRETNGELEITRVVPADSETGTVCPNNRYKLNLHHSTSQNFP
ncbi:hypothetical protein OS493_000616 [Desmophyllum pertusum]|uniref:Uncharacterized protein n=1 Tax=Desmophyllum pertusum TaxID=174260 RepID=A0A9X0DBT6_9CNID|nr:hypothetical protein OS493_000616 [Desmophyllum pertusum]